MSYPRCLALGKISGQILMAGMLSFLTPLSFAQSTLPPLNQLPESQNQPAADQNLPSKTSGIPNSIYPDNNPSFIPSIPGGEAKPITLRAVLQKRQSMPLSLENTLDLAEGKNITIKIAKENENIQRTDFYLRLSDLLPDVTLQYTQTKLVGAVQVFGGNTTSVTRKTYQPQITANYTIYTGGRNLFDIRASKHRLNALEKQTLSTRQDILRQVALAYNGLQAAYWQQNFSEQAVREAEQQVEITDGRFQGGIGLQVDVLQAKSNLALRRQELVLAEQTISEASENLGQLLNLDFQVDILPNSIDASIARLIPPNLTTPDLMALAEKNNPRLATLQESAKAGRSDLGTAIADMFPQINITAYRNRTGPSFNESLPTTYYGIQAYWYPLENLGFARPLRIKQANENAKIAKYNYEQGKRLLQQSVANAWISLNALEKTVDAAKDNITYSQAAYEQAIGRLKEGVGTNVEVQLALTNLARARSDLATAFLNYNQIQATLLFNLGTISTDTLIHGYWPNTQATNSLPSL